TYRLLPSTVPTQYTREAVRTGRRVDSSRGIKPRHRRERSPRPRFRLGHTLPLRQGPGSLSRIQFFEPCASLLTYVSRHLAVPDKPRQIPSGKRGNCKKAWGTDENGKVVNEYPALNTEEW